MLALILRTACAPVQPQFVRVQSCARLLGVSVQTIRNYADDPRNGVEVHRSPGGHRYIDLAAIAQVFVYDIGQADEAEPAGEDCAQGKICVCYSRVSTRSQCIDK